MSEDDIFLRLYRGEIGQVHLTVSTIDTSASEAPFGVYLMTHEDFATICDKLAEQRRMLNGEECAKALDYGGFGNRWFRLSEPVAAWIRSRPPVIATAGHVG